MFSVPSTHLMSLISHSYPIRLFGCIYALIQVHPSFDVSVMSSECRSNRMQFCSMLFWCMKYIHSHGVISHHQDIYGIVFAIDVVPDKPSILHDIHQI